MNVLSAGRAAALAGSALLLAGCFGGGPSAGNMLEALNRGGYLKTQIEGLLPFEVIRSPAALQQVANTGSVDKSACVQAQGQPGYTCDFRIAYTFNGQTRYTTRRSGRFFKANEGWQFALR